MIFLFKNIKKMLCSHEYTLLTVYASDADKSIGYRKEDFYVVYCPKCKKQETLNKIDYDVMMQMRIVDKEYKERINQMKLIDRSDNNE